MSSLHLTTGSTEPPKVEGLIRLYSVKLCPFAQRTRLVLNAKKIPHDIVNINLINKPEWYLKINPQGKVPALDIGSKVIIESLDICQYLEAKYPEHPLTSADPATKRRDDELVKLIEPVVANFYECACGGPLGEDKTPEEWLAVFLGLLEPFESELAERGTTFFGGEAPGMVDFMLWPWGERSGVLALKFGRPIPFQTGQIPLLRQWVKDMYRQPVCKEIYVGFTKYWNFLRKARQGIAVDFDA